MCVRTVCTYCAYVPCWLEKAPGSRGLNTSFIDSKTEKRENRDSRVKRAEREKRKDERENREKRVGK